MVLVIYLTLHKASHSVTEHPTSNLPQPSGRALLSSNDSRALGRLRRHVGRAQLGHRVRILLCLVPRRSVPVSIISISVIIISISISITFARSSPRGAGLLRARGPGRLSFSGPLVLVPAGGACCLGLS